jgi:hypothetical protein
LLLSDLLSEARCIGSRVCPMTVGHGPSALRAFAHSQAHDRHILIISRARAGRSEPTASGWGRPGTGNGALRVRTRFAYVDAPGRRPMRPVYPDR